jgi:hypothetical protein
LERFVPCVELNIPCRFSSKRRIWMGKWLEKYASSMRFWILIVVSVYLGYALYFAIYGLQFSVQLAHDQYVYNLISKNPLWWQIAYYSSEAGAGGFAITVRAVAAIFAFHAAFLFWRKKDAAMPQVRKSACRALALEAVFFLALIPSVVAAFGYNLAHDSSLFYFEHTPELILLYGTALPCLAVVLILPPLLLKLRSAIKKEAPNEAVFKWTSLTGAAYILVVFWFNYLMLWAAGMVSYPKDYEESGWSFLFQPANTVSFALTVGGLLALGVAALLIALPVVRTQPGKVNLTYVGAVMVAFGSYFIFNTLFYFLNGGYEAHPSVWYEVIGSLHNPNLWVIAVVLIGVPLIIQGRNRKKN